MHQLEQHEGPPPTETELAESSRRYAEYQHMLRRPAATSWVALRGLHRRGREDYSSATSPRRQRPAHAALDSNMRDVLIKAIDDLPEREKTVMGLYYEQDMNLREIGEVLGVSGVPVCQLHSQAIARLRSRISGAMQASARAKGRGPWPHRRPAAAA